MPPLNASTCSNVFSNRLDESNGTVENILEMKTTKKTPWHLRFAGKMKTAAAVVAAVVGIGLFLAPMESAQAEKTKDVLTYSAISGVHVACFNGVIYYLSVYFHVFDTSSDYDVWSVGNLLPGGFTDYQELETFNNSAYYAAQYWNLSLPFGDYIGIKFYNSADSSDWITLLLYISPFLSAGTHDTEEGRHAAAYVQHSYGRSYYVDVYCPKLILDVRRD